MDGHPTQYARLLVSMLLVTACASAGSVPVVPTAAELPIYEQQVSEDPANIEARVLLGAGYRQAGRLAEAQELLEGAAATAPEHDAAFLFLGLTYEDLGRYADARSVYQAYLDRGESMPLRDEVAARMPLLLRQERQVAMAAALLDEAAFAQATTDRNTVAVFPFLYQGPNAEYEALGRAFSAMLVTDLSQTDRLTVLERLEVQLLVDEIALGASDLVDPGTAARSGRLLGAGNVVQGVLDDAEDRLLVEAAVVTSDAGRNDASTLSEEDAMQNLFDLQKRLAFDIYSTLGIELTVVERQQVGQRRTDNLQALLAFGRGLEAEDRGDFQQAALFYRQATTIDPSFTEAEERAEPMDQMHDASSVSTGDLAEEAAAQLIETVDVGELFDLRAAIEGAQDMVPTPEDRDPVSEALGEEGFRPTSILNVTVRRPGGGS
jgi:tetratricopeptide (TPR) repeat protein